MATENAAAAAEPTEAPATETKPAEKPEKRRESSKEARKADAKNGLKEYLRKRAAEAEEDDGDEPAPAKKTEPSKTDKPKSDKADAKAEPKTKSEAKDEKPETKAGERAEKVADKIEAMGGAAPDQKKNESDTQYELRLNKALRDLRDAKAEAMKATKDAQTAQGEAKKLQKLLDDGKANPLKVLEHLGITYEDLTKGIIEEKYKPAHKRNDLPPEILEKIERLEAKEKEREAEALRASAENQRRTHISTVQKYINDHADDYPLAASMKWVAEDVVARGYLTGGDWDALPILQELEGNLASNVGTLLGNDKATKALLKKNPALKKALEAAMGLEERVKEINDEEELTMKTVATTSTEAPTRTKALTRAEIKERAKAELRERFKRRDSSDDEDD